MDNAMEESLLQQIKNYARTTALKDGVIEGLAQEIAKLKEENEQIKHDCAELEEKLEEASANEANRTVKKKNDKA